MSTSNAATTSGPAIYETADSLNQYLLFHYGTREDILPWAFGPTTGWAYPSDCAALLSRHVPELNRALDLGCAVGRSSFELARRAHHVLGIDFSQAFVDAATSMKKDGGVSIERHDEGDRTSWIEGKLDAAIDRKRVQFRQGDACALPDDLKTFDAVLMANLIDRLPDPAACLKRLPALVRPGGAVLITSPYTWLEDYTPRDKWLGGQDGNNTLDGLKEHLQDHFTLTHREDLPFLIREHARKFQWSVAEGTVWVRKEG